MYIIYYIHMTSNWIVTYSMDQKSNPNYFKYSEHIDKKKKNLQYIQMDTTANLKKIK
jgi:hypothetical protein